MTNDEKDVKVASLVDSACHALDSLRDFFSSASRLIDMWTASENRRTQEEDAACE